MTPARFVAAALLLAVLILETPSLCAQGMADHTAETKLLETLGSAGLEPPSQLSPSDSNRAFAAFELTWPNGETGTAVVDLSRLRLQSVLRAGEPYYSSPGAEAVAHRGSVNYAPENTLAAIDAAIALGASRAEIDVRTTRDGQLILMHDSSVERTTNGSGQVAAMTGAEISRLDAGGWWHTDFEDEPVPTLEQALRAMRGRIAPDLDLKDARSEDVVQLLAAARMLPTDDLEPGMRPTVFTRDRSDARRLLELAPGLLLRPSINGPSGTDLARLLNDVDAPIVNIDWRNFSPELIDQVHRRGKLAFVNTLGSGDSRRRIRQALAAGADFVQSDLTRAMVELTAADRTLFHAGRPLLDAHNAYPYHGKFSDRVERALRTGLPVAIEQDLCWYEETEGSSKRGRSIVSHGPPFDGREPSLVQSFFDEVAPVLERELASGDPGQWPVMVLNLDLKGQGDHERHHQALWTTLERYSHLLVSAERTSSIDVQAPLRLAPLLVLTGSSDAQQVSFHDRLQVGERLLLFGAAKAEPQDNPEPANNYRRWWNNPWSVVEGKPQPLAAAFEPVERERLAELIERAHRSGLWLRFYTLNGHPPEQARTRGWSAGYNFGSLEAAKQRWRAARDLGVDFIASDQYEDLAVVLAEER